ncbi:PKD domain-containing protein [Pedobacter antarcticus]|uniref:PKD domain-containing protein n=1 Tax=Pedobacter antarcticus TaxID=34086 RepID=UPI00292D94B1|nr:hypothetical protein [Pedobacter antarcticus]
METFVMKGTDKVEWGTGNQYGVVTDWTQLENLQPDSVLRTKNNGTLAGQVPEDKDSPLFTIYTAPEPGSITIGVMEQRPAVMQKLFNTIWSAANSTLVVLAKEKVANLAIRITSRPVNGRKAIITYMNVDALTGYSNNIAKTVQENLAITGTILPWFYLGQEAHYIMQWVNEDGTPINSLPVNVSAGADTTSTTASKALTGTATAAAGKTIVQTYWSQVSGPNSASMTAPTALANTVGGLITGVYVFRLTAVDSAGVENSATVKLTATVA